jgi:hypothetical protein
VSQILEHITWVLQRQQVVVHLVESLFISNYLFQENFVEFTIPINKPAACRSSTIDLPVAYKRQSLIQIQN